MGGAINLVTLTPRMLFEAEGGFSTGGRGIEGWNAIVGSRQPCYYVQGSVALSDRNSWSLSSDYQPPPGSLQGSGERLSSDTQDCDRPAFVTWLRRGTQAGQRRT